MVKCTYPCFVIPIPTIHSSSSRKEVWLSGGWWLVLSHWNRSETYEGDLFCLWLCHWLDSIMQRMGWGLRHKIPLDIVMAGTVRCRLLMGWSCRRACFIYWHVH